MQRINANESRIIVLEEVGNIEREMLVAGDISVDGTKILLRRAHSEGNTFLIWLITQFIIFDSQQCTYFYLIILFAFRSLDVAALLRSKCRGCINYY